MQNTVEVVLSPLVLDLYDLSGKNVIVIDILRASSTICAALDEGAKSIIPVMTVDEALSYQAQGYLTGGERNGIKIEEFDFGNSPKEYSANKILGKDVVLTTTNGTKCIELSKAANAEQIYAGSFFNAKVLIDELVENDKNIVLFCAGWKNRVNMEDTLFAGYMCDLLSDTHELASDSAQMARFIAREGMKNPMKYLEHASHVERFKKLGVTDLEYCLQLNIHPALAKLDGKALHK